ncbi:MAG: GNAT family N-acetyltransferase [Glycocaulis sp.]
MLIRDYTRTDTNALVGIFQAAVLEGSAPFYTAEQRKAWASRITEPSALHERLKDQACLVAADDNGALGFIALQANGHLDMLFVRPGQRRTGTAGALHDALLERAVSNGHAGLSVHASHLARRFLAKRRWQFVRTETVNLHGVTLEHHYMTLQLAHAG